MVVAETKAKEPNLLELIHNLQVENSDMRRNTHVNSIDISKLRNISIEHQGAIQKLQEEILHLKTYVYKVLAPAVNEAHINSDEVE